MQIEELKAYLCKTGEYYAEGACTLCHELC